MKWKTVIMVMVLCLVLMLVSSCSEAEKKWGNGDPPDNWQDSFGNENMARLNFVQSQLIDKMQWTLYGLDGKDAEGKPVHQPGLIEKIAAFEKLNSTQHKILGETIIAQHERIKALEQRPEIEVGDISELYRDLYNAPQNEDITEQ